MSQLVVQVTTIDEVQPHPNADRLALATVGGWQCVVAKDEWTAGEHCVFFPPDTILPEAVSDRFGVTQYLSKGRIKHTRLRGEPSFGLVVKPDDPSWQLGADVAEHYEATKYEPPIRQVQGTARTSGPSEHPKFSRYTDIENLRHYPRVFEDGEEVIVTEKIHGANCRTGIIEGKIVAGSRRLMREQPSGKPGDTWLDATYWTGYFGYSGVKRLLESFIEPQPWWKRLLRRPRTSKTAILYGEVFGPSIQSLDYGLGANSLDFRAFDLMIDGEFVDYGDFLHWCKALNIPTAPVLYRGPYSLDTVRSLSEGSTTLAGDHMREGVVVRPVQERRDPRIGRVILKYVSDSYLLLKNKTDYAEV